MAFQEIKNIVIRGVAACVPEHVVDNRDSTLIGNAAEIEKFIENTAIVRRHTVENSGICTSDLCFEAAQKLLAELNWKSSDVDCLVFVTQTPDYQLPSTACILQHRLGLTVDCFAIQLSLGCSGWVYGLSTIASLMNNGNFKKGLLLVGDTVTVTKSPLDKSTYPLFGDAGTATAIEFEEGAAGIKVHTGTDGKGYDAIIIDDGGSRNPFSSTSLQMKERESGIVRNNLQSHLNGTDVFIFGITRAPQSIKALINHFNINIEMVDYFLFHQANKMMTEKIRKKIGVTDSSKVPYSLQEFGNTSSASIPLTMVTQISETLSVGKHQLVGCGFGVGLSWGTVYFETHNLCCPPVIYL
ncbi:ketoacyl-ACP synthase III [Ferruginibacter paludis]|uniref:3-oxoacyl-ACP synthase III family protein n=1 Tax=Ferruginibacter paludis TaxID=1310417 RepID=UPI0025B340A2|nr:ketoacyl-ACP synthase III [Ferruginibacter paludis]MDN3658879.1 ketoacyl-ACP synthase III [Ferruginibacter paludis]